LFESNNFDFIVILVFLTFKLKLLEKAFILICIVRNVVAHQDLLKDDCVLVVETLPTKLAPVDAQVPLLQQLGHFCWNFIFKLFLSLSFYIINFFLPTLFGLATIIVLEQEMRVLHHVCSPFLFFIGANALQIKLMRVECRLQGRLAFDLVLRTYSTQSVSFSCLALVCGFSCWDELALHATLPAQEAL
jgi:hypothetical protein